MSRSKNKIENHPQPSQIKKEILNLRIKQTKILNDIKDDIKKIRENNISITGLDQLNSNSINKIQEKRKKILENMKNSQNDLDLLLKKIIELETKYKQKLH